MEVNTVNISLERYEDLVNEAVSSKRELNRLIENLKDSECIEYRMDFFGGQRAYYYNLDDIKERVRKELYDEIKKEVVKDTMPSFFDYLKLLLKRR